MKMIHSDDDTEAVTIVFRREELPVLRAALERASFIDTRPEMQGAVIDFVQRVLQMLPDDE